MKSKAAKTVIGLALLCVIVSVLSALRRASLGQRSSHSAGRFA